MISYDRCGCWRESAVSLHPTICGQGNVRLPEVIHKNGVLKGLPLAGFVYGEVTVSCQHC